MFAMRDFAFRTDLRFHLQILHLVQLVQMYVAIGTITTLLVVIDLNSGDTFACRAYLRFHPLLWPW